MKKLFLILIILICFKINEVRSQAYRVYSLFVQYKNSFDRGEFINSITYLDSVLLLKDKLSDFYVIYAYNNIGLSKLNLGLYNETLLYLDKAEKLINNNQSLNDILSAIYINRSRIHIFRREYQIAEDYLEKAIRIYSENGTNHKDVLYRLSTAYLNLGIVYYELRDFGKSLESLQKSLFLRESHNLPDAGLTYLNLAKTYNKLNRPAEAEQYFKKSLESFEKEYGKDYYRTAEVWFEYAKFLQEAGRDTEAVEAHARALAICLKVYGKKHPLTALAWKNTGDYYSLSGDYETALLYYQKALIAVVPDFNNPDITTNPEPGTALFDIRLLEILKSKASAFEKLAGRKTEIKEKTSSLNNSLAALGIALNLIEKIRSSYITEENRLYLAENEKETYLQGVHTAFRLHEITGSSESAGLIYSIAARCKAAVLRSEIAGREYLYSAGLPDTLRQRQEYLARNIAAYSHLITEESRKPHPDSTRISAWKDALFDLNRQNERLEQEISDLFPAFREMLEKTRPVPLAEIQKRLARGETVIDYLISDAASPTAGRGHDNNAAQLYTFIITRNRLVCLESEVDSLFDINTATIRRMVTPESVLVMHNGYFSAFTGALHYMYEKLVAGAEKYFAGRRLIIIPDGRMSLLPFETFIREKPRPGEDFENLQYMIRDYVISYGYSSSLIAAGEKGGRHTLDLIAFVPSYGTSAGVQQLTGAGKELEQAFRRFRGMTYTGSGATKNEFRNVLGSGAVLHLAMHSVADTTDSRFSYLLFSAPADSAAGDRLHNYEISLTKVKSPMVVLSACNSGAGPLNRVEGALSLARSFALAGAGAVIRTSWEINDETSAEIISSFYRHLSAGRGKDEALRLAKLDYISGNPPSLVNPAYWAAYEIMGDTRPLLRNKTGLLMQALVIIAFVSLVLYYFRRRRSFIARSR